jgi:hypothetical protein
MSTKYKFHDQDKLYFISFAVVNWIDPFTPNWRENPGRPKRWATRAPLTGMRYKCLCVLHYIFIMQFGGDSALSP